MARTSSWTADITWFSAPGGPGDLRVLGCQDGNLMTQDQDLSVLGAIGPGEQGEPAEYAQHRQVGESH